MELDHYKFKIKKYFFPNNYLSSKINNKYKDVLIFEEGIFKREQIWIVYSVSVLLLLGIFLAINLKGFNLILDFLKNLITIPLLLVGIVIPVIVLMINIMEKRMDSGFLNIYFNSIDPLKVLRVAIVSLVVCIVLYFFGTVQIGLDLSKLIPISPTPIYGALIVTSILLPLFFTFVVINRIVKSVLDDKTLYEHVLNHFNQKIMLIIENLVEVDYLKKEVKKLPNGHVKIDELFVGASDEFQTYKAQKTGQIIDIDMKELNELSSFLNNEKMDLIIATLPGRQVLPYFKDIAYSKCLDKEKCDKEKIESYLNKTLVINDEKNYDDFYSDFRNLHELTIDSVNNNDKSRFQQLINIYYNCLDFYIKNLQKTDIIKPQYDDYFSIPLIRSIFFDLDDFISSTNTTKEFINILQNGLLILARNSINFSDPMILKLTLDRFLSVYYNSYENKIIVNSIDPIESIIFEINSNLEGWPPQKDFDEQYSLLEDVFNSLFGLFQNSVDFNDVKTSAKVCDIFLSNLGNHPQKHIELISVESDLKNQINEINPENENYQEIEGELKMVQNVLDLPDKLIQTISSLLFEMGAYIVKKDVLENVEYHDCLKSISRNFSNTERLLYITEKSSKDYLHFDEAKIFYFCLVSLKFLKNIKTLPPLEFIARNQNIIKGILEKIKNEPNKWKWFISGDIKTKTDDFLSMCEISAQNYQNIREHKLIAKKLDDNSVKLFKRKLNSEIIKSPMLYEQIPINTDISKAKKRFALKEIQMEPKSYFTQDIPIIQSYRTMIPSLVHSYRKNPDNKDTRIIEELTNNIQCESSSDEALNREINSCIERMGEQGYSVNLIIIPPDMEIEFYQMEEFEEDMKNDNHIFGYYNEITTIVTLGTILTDEILIIDIEGCELTQIHEIKSDVRNPTPSDKQMFLGRDNLSQRDIDLSVIIEITEKFAFDIIDSNAIRKICK